MGRLGRDNQQYGIMYAYCREAKQEENDGKDELRRYAGNVIQKTESYRRLQFCAATRILSEEHRQPMVSLDSQLIL